MAELEINQKKSELSVLFKELRKFIEEAERILMYQNDYKTAQESLSNAETILDTICSEMMSDKKIEAIVNKYLLDDKVRQIAE